jgi:DNA-binding NarL/FixJ family response regulator
MPARLRFAHRLHLEVGKALKQNAQDKKAGGGAGYDSLPQCIADARSAAERAQPETPVPTSREQQVVELIDSGFSNKGTSPGAAR